MFSGEAVVLELDGGSGFVDDEQKTNISNTVNTRKALVLATLVEFTRV